MRKKIIQLGLLFFLVLLVSIGTNQNGFFNSLAENCVITEQSIEYKAFNDGFAIQSVGNYPDAYADAFVQSNSMWYNNEENALGAPDGNFAEIYEDYGNGYLTLDMGLNQEIVNKTGSDFTVVAEGGQYIVRANDDLADLYFPSSILGFGTGNTSFDLSDINRSSARYVWIEWFSGETVELDAIEAIHYNHSDFEADPPQIIGPEDLLVESDQTTIQLSWEVSDLTPWNYSILIDDTVVEQGFYGEESLITYTVDLTGITDEVVVTLILDDAFANRAEDAVRIEIQSSTSTYIDAFANAFVQSNSMWYDDEENAYGAPDGQYAEIYEDYGNGYLTLDMGLNQEIINGTGSDFTVIAKGGQYIVKANDDLGDIHFPDSILGIATGNTSFDLSDINRSSARYVWIEWFTDETTELDAIEAIHHNQPDYEADPPQITGSEDLLVWSNQNTVKLSWNVYDLTPWNYSILVDETIVEQGFYWDESLITYTVDLTDITDEVVITLILDDTFINRAEDTVRIEIRPGTPTTELSDTSSNTTFYPLIPLLGGFLAISLFGKWNKRKIKRT